VNCYGLWTYRKWALSVSKVLAVVYVVVSLIGFIASLIGRVGIISSLSNLAISIAILLYFFGSSNVSERLQQVYSRLGHDDGHQWEGYK